MIMNWRMLIIVCVTLAWSAHASIESLVVIHTNDFHGHIAEEAEYAGAARIAALVTRTRKKHDNVLVLDAGDAISGTPVSTMFEGSPIFEVMNLIGYDAAAVGNHEFDHGCRRIEEFKRIANHPLLAANAFAPDGRLIADAPLLVRQVGDMRVGIIGLITDYTPRMITPVGNENISFADPTLATHAMVTALRPQVDLLIVLSHLGHQEEKQLAMDVPGIDLIVGGHSHTLVDPPVPVGDTWVVQAKRYGSYVGYLDIKVDTEANRIVSLDGQLIPAKDLPRPKRSVAKAVADWERRVSEIVDVKIAESDHTYTTEQIRPILERILAKAAGTDFGYYNLGGVRDVLRKGDVTARHIWNIEPFGNSLVRMTTDGATLKRIVTMDFETHELSDSFDPDNRYTFATNSFVANQAKVRTAGKVTVEPLNQLIRDVIIGHISEHGIEPPQ